jgi:membrane protein DedA with SNARE-associated domain
MAKIRVPTTSNMDGAQKYLVSSILGWGLSYELGKVLQKKIPVYFWKSRGHEKRPTPSSFSKFEKYHFEPILVKQRKI